MKENKRFFGLHFDFHADDEAMIGSRTDPKDIEWYINEARPDFIQCDCKGHPGICSYPSKVGRPAKNLVKDNLRIWCDTVKKHNIPIYVHYSGVEDEAYTTAHPDQATHDKDNNPLSAISLFGNYVHELLIPQFKELISEYGIDGAWIDGDCWAVKRDYSELAKAYLWEGITEAEHNKVMRDAYFRYLKTYVDEIHAFAPDFKIASNWAYSSYIPEEPTINVDFISGDYCDYNSVHIARYESRCIAAHNKPWDLMAWSFEWSHFAEKPAIQLQQEAATTLMMGGGFQMYIQQNHDGSAKRNHSDRLRKIADFVHARRMLFEKKPIAQVAVLYSADSFYQKSNVFVPVGETDALIGALNLVLDSQYTANVILEYQLDNLGDYEIVLVPEWKYMSDKTKEKLADYARNGGNLVITGAELSKQFGELLGMDFGEIKNFEQVRILDDNGCFIGITDVLFKKERCDVLDLKTGNEMLYETSDLRDPLMPSYRIENLGNGKITWIPFDMGYLYHHARTYIHVNFIKKIFADLSKPFVELNKKMIDITLQKQENGTILNLLNLNQGRHSQDILLYDEIDPIYDIEIVINKKYKNVSMPLGEIFDFETKDDKTVIHLKRLDIHSIIFLEE